MEFDSFSNTTSIIQGCQLDCLKTNQCLFEEALNWKIKYKFVMSIGGLLAIIFLFSSFLIAYFLYNRHKTTQKIATNHLKNQKMASNLRLVSTPNINQNLQNSNFLNKIWNKKNFETHSQIISTNNLMKNSFNSESTSSGFPSTIALAEMERVN